MTLSLFVITTFFFSKFVQVSELFFLNTLKFCAQSFFSLGLAIAAVVVVAIAIILVVLSKRICAMHLCLPFFSHSLFLSCSLALSLSFVYVIPLVEMDVFGLFAESNSNDISASSRFKLYTINRAWNYAVRCASNFIPFLLLCCCCVLVCQ